MRSYVKSVVGDKQLVEKRRAQLVQAAVQLPQHWQDRWTRRLDAVLLHPLLGMPVFLLTTLGAYEAFLLVTILGPTEGGWLGDFVRDFQRWCYRGDPRTGGVSCTDRRNRADDGRSRGHAPALAGLLRRCRCRPWPP